MLASVVTLGLLGYYFSKGTDKKQIDYGKILSGEFPPYVVKDWFSSNHSLYPRNSQYYRIDSFIPKFPQAQGNPSRKDSLAGMFPDPNAKQSSIIDKTNWGNNWKNYAGRTSNELLFDGRKNNKLIEEKYNQDDWCWGKDGNGEFLSPIYKQYWKGSRPSPPKINSIFLEKP